MTDRYAVAGNPVAHSRSPLIHARFACQTGQDIEYRRLLVAHGDFPGAARRFFDEGGRGLNVTLPFKQDAFAFASGHTARAVQAHAVNTLALGPDGSIIGDNTDGAGLIRDMCQNLGWSVAGKRVLMLGAGGAARGALGPLLSERPRELVIANRTVARAQELAHAFAEIIPIHGCSPGELAGQFDLVVNASSAGLGGEGPGLAPGLLAPGAFAYDMVYASSATPFVQWARGAGAGAAVDGLGMLVEQAAESFLLWRGIRPDTAPVISQLRAGYRIRPARGEADMLHAARLFREYQNWLRADLCFQDFERELATLPGSYAAPQGELLLAECDGEPFACVAMRPLAEGVCEMKRLYVPEPWRGAGLGRALALAVIDVARSAGYRRLRLDTLQRLREANQLYAGLGFHRCDPCYENPLEGVVYWELEIRPESAAR